ncbi:MAG: sigma-70 family RNA polymerase sigma factor [Oscillospiraceae bacterium]|nr:sigma-70 family RNA polymerase sigma factor [Oscillospiraceae bacterium]
MTDEKRLIRKIKKNADRNAADVLIRRYYDEILSYIYKQTSDKHIAMDLTQDVFVTVLGQIKRYDDRKAGFRTWLYKITTNKIIDYYRSRAKIQNKILDLDDIDIPDKNELTLHLENTDLSSKILTYIATFNAESQNIFRLKVYGEYTFTEISDLTEIPEPTVKTKYYRMIKTLREEFKNEYYS